MAKKREAAPEKGSKAGKVAISMLVFVILAQIVHTIGAFAMMSYYVDPSNFSLWSKLMMSGSNGPGPEFFAASIAVSALSGAIFAWAFALVGPSIPGSGAWKGLNYGILLFLVSSVPGLLAILVLLAVPPPLVLSWGVENILLYCVSGVAFAKLIR